jgi:hypothetical protein
MNVTQMISDVRSRTGDVVSGGDRYTDMEILGWLNSGEQLITTKLINVQRAFFTIQRTLTTVTATELVALPDDFYDIVRVEYDAAGAAAYVQGKQVAIRDLGALATLGNLNTQPTAARPYFYVIGGVVTAAGLYTTTQAQIGLLPVPTAGGASSLRITYVRRPLGMNMFKTRTGTSTGGSTTTVADTAANTYADDFWNNTELTIVTADAAARRGLEGVKKIVSDFTNAGGVFTFAANNAYPIATATGMAYRVDDLSILPSHLHPLMVLYAEARARMKVGQAEVANGLLQEYKADLAEIAGSYVANIDVGLVGDQTREKRSQVS